MKRLISWIMVWFLCAALCAPANADATPAPGTPEQAIYAFIESVKTGELNRITDAFCVQDLLDGYDPDDRDADFIPKPTLDERLLQVYEAWAGFCVGFQIDWSVDVPDLSDVDVESLLDPEQYRTLEVMRIDLPEEDEQLHKNRISNDNMYTRLFRADGWDYRTALLKLDGETYYCGFYFVIYGGKYEILELSCPMLTISRQLVTMPCTEQEYEQIIGA